MIAQRRDENEPEIILALRAAGCFVLQMDKSAGFDLLAIRDDNAWVIEVKQPGKESKLTKAEEARALEIAQQGSGYYFVVSSPEMALEIIGTR